MHALRSVLIDRSSRFLGLLLLAALALSACAPQDQATIAPSATSARAAAPTAASTAAPTPAAKATHDPSTVNLETAAVGQAAVVTYVQDGNLLVWDQATGRTQTIVDSSDVIDLTLSNDGQVVTFLRRSVVQITGHPSIDWIEQSALWAADRSGENARELSSAEELRTLLSASETDSTNIPQMAWIPQPRRLMYTGWTYLVQAEGESHATPTELFLVDADSGENRLLLPTTDDLRVAPAPDGQHVALMSLTGLSFIGAEGSNRSRELLTYPHVGPGGSAFPSGVWTQDSSAFLITGPIDPGPGRGSDLTIWRVPVDGSPAQPLATYNDSHGDSVTFSPDSRYAAFFQSGPLGPTGVAADYGWFVTPLTGEQGALAAASSA